MEKVENGKNVILNYTGKFDDGTVFDSSLFEGREPLKTVLGQGNLIPGFEKNIVGLNVGDKKNFTIEPVDGYGEYLDGLVTVIPRDRIPESAKVGDVLKSESERGTINVMVKEINDEGVKIDANHPMAGKKLSFEVEILDVN